MNFRHIEVFFAVMTAGTVTEAARQLGVSQPSVTTTLRQAEAKLGIQLFLREGGRLIPTEEARILFEEAERAHEALEAMRTLAERLEIGRGGHVRIAAVSTISLELLPDAIQRFEQRHTGFHYSVATLNTEEIISQLDGRKGTFHLGFTFGTLEGSGFDATRIGAAELFAVLPADWHHAGDVVEIAELADRPFISGFDHTALAIETRRHFTSAGVEPLVVARSHTHYLAGCLAQRGIGYAILDALTTRALLHNPLAAAITAKPLAGSPTIDVSAVYPSQRRLSNAAVVFIDCIQQAYDDVQAALRERLG